MGNAMPDGQDISQAGGGDARNRTSRSGRKASGISSWLMMGMCLLSLILLLGNTAGLLERPETLFCWTCSVSMTQAVILLNILTSLILVCYLMYRLRSLPCGRTPKTRMNSQGTPSLKTTSTDSCTHTKVELTSYELLPRKQDSTSPGRTLQSSTKHGSPSSRLRQPGDESKPARRSRRGLSCVESGDMREDSTVKTLRRSKTSPSTTRSRRE